MATDVPFDETLTLDELGVNAAAYTLTDLFCADAPTGASGSTVTPTITNGAGSAGSVTLDLVAGADVTCTFTNVKDPSLVLTKNTVGGDGTFDFAIISAAAGTTVEEPSPSLTTSGGTASTAYRARTLGGDQYVQSVVTITYADVPPPETPPAIAFTGASSAVLLSVGVTLLAAGAGLVILGRHRRRHAVR